MSLYVDTLLEKIKTVIDAADGGAIKTFFYGDPVVLPKSSLPALCIIKDSTEIGDFSNAEDYHRVNVVLTLIVDIRDYFSDTPKNVHVGDQAMYNIFEGRNANFTLKTTSIVDILRKNHNLTNNANIDLTVPMNMSYGFTLGKRGPRSWAQEANLAFSVYFAQERGNA